MKGISEKLNQCASHANFKGLSSDIFTMHEGTQQAFKNAWKF